MGDQDAIAANPAAIAATLHYLAADIESECPRAAEILRDAAAELEALREAHECKARGARGLAAAGAQRRH